MMIRTNPSHVHSNSRFHSRPPVWVADMAPGLKRHTSA